MSFSTDCSRFSTGTQTVLQKVRKGIIMGVFTKVIYDTPVFTSQLRFNWQPSEGEPDYTFIPFLRANMPLVPAAVTIARAQTLVDKTTGDKPVFLCNSAPYAYRIEFEGWSKKAPEGMMRLNVASFDGIVKSVVAKRGNP